ncbi:hypothetical protein B0H19DRAFT_1166399 [Mycena capillaripes]|nr:hypothetical protein B0H19DRAFT_1166399 [Mycena capillaripes]
MRKFSTRCFHFEDDGRPIDPSSHHHQANSICKFSHPNDEEWLSASPARRRFHPNPPSKYPSFSRRDHDSRSRSPHRSVRGRSRSRSPISRHRRSDTSESGMDPRRDGYRRASGSIASNSPAPSRQPKQPSFYAPPPPTSAAPPPPPPALPIPPSLPAIFTASDVAPKPSTQEVMKVMWDKLLPLMADCVEARKVHQDSQKELQGFERMLQTPRYTTLVTDAEKELVSQRLAELKAARDEKGKELTAALNALKDTQWWPVGPNQDESAAEKYRELIQYAVQLNNTASEMYQAYVTKSLNAPASGAAPETPANVAPQESSSRPLKRRRVSNAADDTPAIDVAEVAEIEQKLMTMEERIGELQNDLFSFETQNEEDILAQIDAKLESFSFDPPDHPGGPSSSELQRVEQNVQKTNKDLDDLGQVVASLITESNSIRTQDELLDKEKQKHLEELTAMQLKFRALEESSRTDQETFSALNAAFKALAAQQPPSPPSLPLEFILRAIDEPIRDAVQSAVRPMVEDLEKDLKEKMAKQDAETYGQLWGKLALTLKVVEEINKVTPAPSPAVSVT